MKKGHSGNDGGVQGNTVTCDDFFTSYGLAEELLKRKMALVGTIRTNKPELPPKLLQIKHRALLSSLFAFTKTHTAVSNVPKRGKNVLLLSTKHREPAVSDTEKKKPVIITDYNRCKGGVDNLEEVVVLWSAVDPSWNQGKTFRRRLFLEELGKALVMPQMSQRQRIPRTPSTSTTMEDQQEGDPNNKKRKVCTFCTDKKKKSASTCNKCGKHICKVHTITYCSSCCE